MELAKRALTGRSITEFGGIEPNPDYETLMKAVEIVKKNGSISFGDWWWFRY